MKIKDEGLKEILELSNKLDRCCRDWKYRKKFMEE